MYKIKKRIQVLLFGVMVMLFGIGGADNIYAASADNSLSSITLSEGELSPNFVYNVVNYQVTVGADVSSIEVSAKTSNSAASIQSGTGTVALQEGENTIHIVVQAENGNLATYTIKVNRSSAGTTTATEPQVTEPEAPESQDVTGTTSEGEEGDSAESESVTPTLGDTVDIVDKIAEEMIPVGFETTEITIGEDEHTVLYHAGMDMTLLCVNDGEAEKLLIYHSSTGETVPFVKIDGGSHYLVLVTAPEEQTLGEGYIYSTLNFDGTSVDAFQENSSSDMDMYIVYGISNDGVTGWFWYDVVQGTYIRYVKSVITAEPAEIDVTQSEDYLFLQNSYNDLSNKYTQLKNRDTKYMIIFVVIIAALLIVIVNLILFRRTYQDDEMIEEKPVASKKPVEDWPDNIPEKKSAGTSRKPVTDDKDIDKTDSYVNEKKELEEEPKKKRFGRREDIFDKSDAIAPMPKPEKKPASLPMDSSGTEDDLEILDLNDL